MEDADDDGEMKLPERVDANVDGDVDDAPGKTAAEDDEQVENQETVTHADLFKNEDADGDGEMNVPERADEVHSDAGNLQREMGTEDDDPNNNRETEGVAESSMVEREHAEGESNFTGGLDNPGGASQHHADHGDPADLHLPPLLARVEAGSPIVIGPSSSAPAGPSSSNDPPVNPPQRQREMPSIGCVVCNVARPPENMVGTSCQCGHYALLGKMLVRFCSMEF